MSQTSNTRMKYLPVFAEPPSWVIREPPLGADHSTAWGEVGEVAGMPGASGVRNGWNENINWEIPSRLCQRRHYSRFIHLLSPYCVPGTGERELGETQSCYELRVPWEGKVTPLANVTTAHLWTTAA